MPTLDYLDPHCAVTCVSIRIIWASQRTRKTIGQVLTGRISWCPCLCLKTNNLSSLSSGFTSIGISFNSAWVGNARWRARYSMSLAQNVEYLRLFCWQKMTNVNPLVSRFPFLNLRWSSFTLSFIKKSEESTVLNSMTRWVYRRLTEKMENSRFCQVEKEANPKSNALSNGFKWQKVVNY